MAWPPPSLPTNRTNAAPQQDTHPADHNALALAMNDTVAQVKGLILGAANQSLVATGSPSVASGAVQQLSYSALSTSTWGSGPVFVVPAGVSGWFALMLNVAGPQIQAGAFADCIINAKTTNFNNYVPGSKSKITTVG